MFTYEIEIKKDGSAEMLETHSTAVRVRSQVTSFHKDAFTYIFTDHIKPKADTFISIKKEGAKMDTFFQAVSKLNEAFNGNGAFDNDAGEYIFNAVSRK